MKIQNKTSLATSIAALGMIVAPSAMASVVLSDDFGDNVIGTATEGGAINGGFQIISNENGGSPRDPGTATESSSNAVITTDDGNSSNSGIVSINSFSAASATSISTTWVVDSQDFAVANHNGTEFLLQSSTAFRNAANGTQTYFQVEFNRGTGLTIDAHNGTAVETLLGVSSAVAFDTEMGNGYSVTVDLDVTSWTVTTSGLSTDVTETGLWSAAATSAYSDFQTDLHVVSTIQKRNAAGTIGLNLDSVSVDVIPEPSSTALLGLGALALILRRRK